MQGIVPAITAAASFLGGTGGAILTTGLAVASTVASVQAANASADVDYQNAAAQAKQATENAAQIRRGAQADAQDADFEAAAILATVQARNAGSGFLLSSPGFERRKERNMLNANITRERIIEDGEIQAESQANSAESAKSNAQASQRTKRSNRLAGVLQVGTDLVSGATLVNKRRTSANDRNRVGVD